ncbi:MAG: dihydroorotate dehydrogenase [Deltaproteobacteria bacterium]|nr:dihydroorotate dehydrogenase [Deltaproteobacteria bacterium]
MNGKINMEVKIGSLHLKSPVMTASGTFGYGEEFADFCDLNRLGAIVVKGISLQPRKGNPPPRIVEVAGGMLNAIGLQNVGLDAFISQKLPPLSRYNTPIIVNVFGEDAKEYTELATRLDGVPGVAALEVNISCPNVKEGGVHFGVDHKMAQHITSLVRRATKLPLIVKLTPNVTDIASIAKAVADGGADAISLINTLTGMSVDIKHRRPHLQNITGGLSGPAIKPIALRMLWQVRKAVSLPLIGIGGIMNATDALEFLITGAVAIQVGTANFINPRATMEITDGIERYLAMSQITDVNSLIGSLQT